MQLHERKILDRSRSQIRAQKATLEISGNFTRQKFDLQQENSQKHGTLGFVEQAHQRE
jgi:hypothetical protein|tara:strand:+ start:196 stop:369 length:174 start_codon:yes stop_codon:yes gene_type:complete